MKTTLTLEDFDNFDIEGYYAAKKLRRERPWTYDIIRVLWMRPSGTKLKQLYRDVWALRYPSGLPTPKAFEETIRRTIYDHTSEGAGRAEPDADLFFSPFRGVWAVHPDRAAAWLKRHELPDA